MTAPYAKRLERLRKLMKDQDLDAFLVLDRINTMYLTGFPCSYSILIVDSSQARFITDPRYGEAATAALKSLGFKVLVQPTTKVRDFLTNLVKKSDYESTGYEGSISVNEFEGIRSWVRKTKLHQAGELINKLRRVKDDAEIKLIRKAVTLADEMMANAISLIKPGLTESELSRRIRFSSEELGGEGESFPNIVASGPNGSRPHHHAEARKFKKGDPITIDLGAKFGGYCSDLTRNPVLGKPSAEFEKIYNVCLQANEAAIKALKPGMTGVDVDAVARDVIASAGYEKFFGHGLGHGVGLEIHEEPRLSPRASGYKLTPGNIVTIEPGIYLPGKCGVRIEDYVLVTENGCKVLSKAPKELTIIN